jgi:hypothetical protein
MAALIFLLFGFQFIAAFFIVFFMSVSKGISMFPVWELLVCVIVCLCGYIYAQKKYGIPKEKRKTLVVILAFNVMFILSLGSSDLFLGIPDEDQTSSLMLSLPGMISAAINFFPVVSMLFFVVNLFPKELGE